MNVLKNFFEFIKKLILKKEKSIKETIDNDKTLEISNEQLDLEKWHEVLSQIKVGDIIWAKRYLDESLKKNIPEGHREGPFVVLGKTFDDLICAYGTSIEPTANNIDNYFKAAKKYYSLAKDTYFQLNGFNIVNKFSYIKNLTYLTEEDKEFILRQFKLKNKNLFYNHKIRLPLQVGDVISYNNIKRLIIDINNDELLCIPLNKDTAYRKLNFNEFKNLDYSKVSVIKNNKRIKYIYSVSDNVILYVLNKYKEYIAYIINQKVTQRGSIISKNNKYYYVYGEEGQEWLIFEIIVDNEQLLYVASQKFDTITLNNKVYYTNYEGERINKKEVFKTIYLSTLDEIENVKTKKKSYKKEQRNKNKELELYFKQKMEESENIIIDSIIFEILSACSGNIKEMEKLYVKIDDYIKKENYLNIKRCSIVSKENKYYYIFGEEGTDWLVFEIFNENIEKGLDEFIISDQTFYTNYKSEKVNKKENLNFILNATEEQIDMIKKNKKSYNKIYKIKDKPEVSKKEEYIEINGQEYIIKEQFDNIIACTSIYYGRNSQAKIHYFNLDNTDIIYNNEANQKQCIK